MEKLKVGIIGLGMGSIHLQGYLEHEGVEVVAVADRVEQKRVDAQKKYNIPRIYAEGIDMINSEKLDVLSVATPNDQHMPLTIAGLEAGANVLCEKPMAMNVQEAEQMMAVAKKCGRKLGIDFSYRFTPQSQVMKTMVDEGMMGDIYYARSQWFRRRGIPGMGGDFNTGTGATGSWFFDKKQAGGGPLIDLGVHRLDLALWLMGYPEPDWIMGSTYDKLAVDIAKMRGLEYTVEDLACAMIKFKNGATLELNASWAANVREKENMYTRLLGDKGGMLHFNLNEGYEFAMEYYQQIGESHFNDRLHSFPPVRTAFWQFAEACIKNTDFLVRPEEGVIVMRILDAIYESAATGAPVKF